MPGRGVLTNLCRFGGVLTAIFQRPLISVGASFEAGSRSFTERASFAN